MTKKKKGCTLCPCCKTFEDHQALVCATTAQNETNLEVGAFFAYAVWENAKGGLKFPPPFPPVYETQLFFLPPPTTCNTFLPVSRSRLDGEMPQTSWDIREIFLSIIVFFTHHSVLTVPGEHLSTFRCVRCIRSVNSQRWGSLIYCLSCTPFITDVFTCLSTRTITSWESDSDFPWHGS